MEIKNKLYENQGIHVITALFTVEQGIVKVLLIKRKNEPFYGSWVLTGGALYNNESLEEGAYRELKEKTGIENIPIKQFKAFGRVDRSPVMRMVAVAYIGIIDSNAEQTEWNGIIFSNDGMSDHWNRTPGKKLSLKVFTNGDKVELYVNGNKVGEQENSLNPKTRNQLRFDNIEYQPGYIEAVAYKDSKRYATHRIETTGEAKKLQLSADKDIWHADGQDLQHIRIFAIDNKGRRVPTARQKLSFKVEGDARIVAVDNGNNLSDELHVGTERSLYNGSALVILRAGKTSGKITLTISGEGFKSQRITLKTI